MTFDALVAIIALGAGGLIIVMLVIAFPRMDEGSRRGRQSRSAESSSQRQVTIRKSRPMPTLRGAPSQRATPEARTTRARKPPWRPAWHRITDASTTLLHELSGALLYLRAWGRRWATTLLHELSGALLYLRAWGRRWAREQGFDAEAAVRWGAAIIALSLAGAYVIVHI